MYSYPILYICSYLLLDVLTSILSRNKQVFRYNLVVPFGRQMFGINWEKELELFRQSDINKPAWKDSYTINRTASGVSYTAADPNLPTRRIVLEFDPQQKPLKILIETRVSNNLYSSADTLEYVPGDFYSIRKAQDVRVLGRQVYRVKGMFEKQ